jgi:uncharacterized protein YkwD
MALSRFAFATLVCGLAAVLPTTAQAHKGRRHGCSDAHSAANAQHGTRDYRAEHCGSSQGRSGHRAPRSKLLYFSAVDGHCPDTGLTPTTHNVAEVRAATLCLVNRERTDHGERALRWNNRLVAAAQSHSESMAFGGYFQHISPNGETPVSRMRHVGYIYSSRIGFEVGENIAWGSLWLGTPRAIVAAWMASPGHRANILDANYRETGIGVSPHLSLFAPGQSGGMYTQDFGVIVTG